MKQITFRKKKLTLGFDRYYNERLCITLIDANTGEEYLRATVNIPDVELGKDELIIKDYSENEGILKALVDAGVIEETGKYVQTGFVKFPVCLIKHK